MPGNWYAPVRKVQKPLRKKIIMDGEVRQPIPDEPSRLYRIVPGVVGITPLPRRVKRPRPFASTDAIVRFMSKTVRWERETNELCWIIPLDNHGRQMYDRPVLIAIGATDSVPMDEISIFRAALVMEAGQIILLHNHPTGEATISNADRERTQRIAKAGRLLRIPLERHIILVAQYSRSVPEVPYGKRKQGRPRRPVVRRPKTVGSTARAGDPDGACNARECEEHVWPYDDCPFCSPETRDERRRRRAASKRGKARRVSRREIREPEARGRGVRGKKRDQ